MEDSRGEQNMTEDEEMTIDSADDRVQMEEQADPALSSNAMAVIPDQNEQIPADDYFGPSSALIPRAPRSRAPKYRGIEYILSLAAPIHQLAPIAGDVSVQGMNLQASSSGGANVNLQLDTVAPRRFRNLRRVVVPEGRDDGDISMELSNAVAAGDDIPAGYIRIRVTVQNRCPVANCKLESHVKFMTIVSPEDAPTRLSDTTTAYFYCFHPGCDITFELEDDPEDSFDDFSRFPCPQCHSPLQTRFLFSSRFWKRFTSQPCGRHASGKKDKNPDLQTLGLDRLNLNRGSID